MLRQPKTYQQSKKSMVIRPDMGSLTVPAAHPPSGDKAENRNIVRSDFKTSPRAQSLCWDEVFNPQNTKCIPAVEPLAPP